jgi:hypothetical protein
MTATETVDVARAGSLRRPRVSHLDMVIERTR